MTDAELQHLRTLCEAASFGPWEVHRGDGQFIGIRNEGDYVVCGGIDGVIIGRADAAFIAAARTAVPALLDEIDRLHAELEQERRDRFDDSCEREDRD